MPRALLKRLAGMEPEPVPFCQPPPHVIHHLRFENFQWLSAGDPSSDLTFSLEYFSIRLSSRIALFSRRPFFFISAVQSEDPDG